MSIHLVTVAQIKQIANLTEERRWILQLFGASYRKYYLMKLTNLRNVGLKVNLPLGVVAHQLLDKKPALLLTGACLRYIAETPASA